MGRRNRRRSEDARPLSTGSTRRREGDYLVQSVTGGQAGKTYICPGCNQGIAAGIAHVVAWSDREGPEGRRHWHTPCWRRLRR